jgi:hypothetical protein
MKIDTKPTQIQGDIREGYHVYVCLDTLCVINGSTRQEHIEAGWVKVREAVAAKLGQEAADALNLTNVGYNDITIVMAGKTEEEVQAFLDTMYDSFPVAPLWWKQETGARNVYAQHIKEEWNAFDTVTSDPKFEWDYGLWEMLDSGVCLLPKADVEA